MTTAAELMVKVSADTSGAESDLRSFSSRVLGGGMGAVFGGALLAGGVTAAVKGVGNLAKGVVGLGASAVSAGADFAFSMDQVGAVLGATDAEMQQLSDTAVGLGMNPNLKVSTEEAAAAMYSLATAGLTTTDIVGGAAEATVLLANATGGDMAQAGQVATDAMALWGMSAGQLGEAINGVVGVSNASKFDLNDYALALAQGGGVAAMAGVSFEDFNASIAATSSYFSSGSDAGTSMKTMLASLTPGTKAQKDAMWELGLLTEDGTNAFYDANGQLKGMYDIVGLLNGATKDLTEQKRAELLQTIFGNDAMRSAGALAGMTADEYEAMYMVVNEGTSAMGQAKIRTDNLSSAWQTFQDTIDAAKTKMGLTLEAPLKLAIKALTPVVDMLAGFIQPYIDEASAWLTTNIPIIQARIPIAFEAWNSAPGLISGLAAAYGELTGQAGQLKPVVDDLSAMDQALQEFNQMGSAQAFPAFFLGIAAAMTAGTAEFDKATGDFTAKWKAFQVTLTNEGTLQVKVNWDVVVGGIQGGASDPIGQWVKDHVGKGKFVDTTVGVRIHWGQIMAPESEDPFQAWVKNHVGKGKTFDFSPQVMVTPKYDINPAAALGNLSDWLAAKLNAGAAAIAEVLVTPVIDTAAWADTMNLFFGPGSAVQVSVTLAWEWIDEKWKEAFTVDVPLAWAWVSEEWKDDFTVLVHLNAKWISTAWKNAVDVVVNLWGRWAGGEPGAAAEGPLPDQGGFHASGTLSARGGLTWVGENGPELVALPGASRVWNNRDSMAMAGAGGPQVVINAAVTDALDIEVLARRVAYYLKRG